MVLQVKTHIQEEIKESSDVIDRLISENLDNKLNTYLKKFEDKEDSQGIVEFFIDKNKKGLFDSKLNVVLDGKSYRYAREDYKKMDDLINHLFDHLKEDLSNK